MIGADLCNLALAAVASGRTFETSGLPQTLEAREFWKRLVVQVAEMKAAGIHIDALNEFDGDTPSEPINLPDASGVSFPSMIGGLSSKPKPKKRKKVRASQARP